MEEDAALIIERIVNEEGLPFTAEVGRAMSRAYEAGREEPLRRAMMPCWCGTQQCCAKHENHRQPHRACVLR
jgi:hypothetical protein